MRKSVEKMFTLVKNGKINLDEFKEWYHNVSPFMKENLLKLKEKNKS